MVLNDDEAYKIIAQHPSKVWLLHAQRCTQKLLMHIKGIGLDAYIDRIDAWEKEDIIKIRKKYAVSNQPMFSRILRPLDKVFSAKGGSAYYNLGDAQTQKFKQYLSNIVFGYTLKQWLEVFWMPATAYDPMGLIMVEIDQMGHAYPTYRSLLDIYEMKMTGRNVEYVIFNIDDRITQAFKDGEGPKDKLYRIIDDVSDRLVRLDNGRIVDVSESYPNYFGRVPATVISNIYDPAKCQFVSAVDDVIELADQFLREGSVKNIFKNYFGFPIAWGYQSACPECKGQKVLNGRPCDYCKGSGIKSKYDPSEIVALPVPQSKDEPILAPDVAGYITPDIEGWGKMTDELDLLERYMFQTLWGTHQVDDKGKNETATGKFIDTQPVNDKLNKFSDAEEMVETFITDLIGGYLFGQAYKGSSITAGRRYMIETPDEIWEKLQSARKDGAPTAALYDLYNDYLQARYSANAMEMQKMLKLAKIEPLPFVRYDEFARLQTFPDVILRKKFWFERWVCSKTEPEILTGDLVTLQKDFDQFCVDQDKQLNEQVQENPAINSAGAPAPGLPPGAPKPEPKPEPAAA
jgi:hypothetical protein